MDAIKHEIQTQTANTAEAGLSYGKLRGLQQLINDHGVISMLALDHREALMKGLQKHLPQRKVTYNDLVEEKLRMVRILAPYASAILLDPEYGAAQAIAAYVLPKHIGLVLALEATSYSGSEFARLARPTEGWSVGKIKRLGASAVKLMVDYHPEASTASQIESFVDQVAESCKRYDIAFILEPVCYPIRPGCEKDSPAFAREKPFIVLESVRRLGNRGADLLKLEFPDDPRYERDENLMHFHCRQISACSPIPWVLLSAAMPFDSFQKMVEIACTEGASGFLAGRTIWQEALELAGEKDRAEALQTLALSRLGILTAIAKHQARPCYSQTLHTRVPQGWQHHYQEL